MLQVVERRIGTGQANQLAEEEPHLVGDRGQELMLGLEVALPVPASAFRRIFSLTVSENQTDGVEHDRRLSRPRRVIVIHVHFAVAVVFDEFAEQAGEFRIGTEPSLVPEGAGIAKWTWITITRRGRDN